MGKKIHSNHPDWVVREWAQLRSNGFYVKKCSIQKPIQKMTLGGLTNSRFKERKAYVN